ncbi:MAG: RING finger protein [Planctomycetota bacterium]
METFLDSGKPLVRCPYCRDGFEMPRDAVACAACGARHHVECFRELDRCASCGGYEALARREIRCHRTHAKLTNFMTLVVISTSVFTSTIVTYTFTVDRNADAPSRAHAREIAALEAKEERIRAERERLDADRRSLVADREQLAQEHRDWRTEKSALQERTASELEVARHLAREGWRVAELIAQSPPGAEGTLRRLREARRSVPSVPGNPSILEQSLDERIAYEQERLGLR